jgi:sugar phosphate isomerase/epimerase
MFKLSCSNIAWTKEDEISIYPILRSFKILGIEVAPFIQWPDIELATMNAVKDYAKFVSDEGFLIPSMQGIFFGTNFSSIFDKSKWENILTHCYKIAKISEYLGSDVVIFGAPKMRQSNFSNFQSSCDFVAPLFVKLAEIFNSHGSILCIEPCTSYYNCNFIINSAEANYFVQLINSPNFGLHLDSSSLFMANEDISEVSLNYAKSIKHFHISEPDLKDFNNSIISHKDNIKILLNHGYKGWFSIEMKSSNISFSERGLCNII